MKQFVGASLVCTVFCAMSAAGQGLAAKIPRTPANTPDLSGIWQALNTANWDLQTHGPEPGPDPGVGALSAVAPGVGVVEGGEIPYLPGGRCKACAKLQRPLA